MNGLNARKGTRSASKSALTKFNIGRCLPAWKKRAYGDVAEEMFTALVAAPSSFLRTKWYGYAPSVTGFRDRPSDQRRLPPELETTTNDAQA
jgi:hypothetical protein